MLDERSAIPALRRGEIDLLIVAPRFQWWDERAAIEEITAEATRAEIAVLALVPAGDSDALRLAFDIGVADCAAHPVDADEAAVRVAALLHRKTTADRLRAEAAAVRRLALTDPVTGLWNRHYLDTELAARIEAALAAARPLSVLMIDIDRFKLINDRHGHTIGDQVLHAVAARLAGGIRGNDILARFGGDELVIVMPDTDIVAAAIVAERLRQRVADAPTVPFQITISVGVAELGFDEPSSSVLARADKALYQAKIAGRNQVAAAS